MVEVLKHECGIGLIRLKKPLSYFKQKYGNTLWGLDKFFLLMEKQHNRGQDGAGIACLKLNVSPGNPYILRHRVIEPAPVWQTLVKDIEEQRHKVFTQYSTPDELKIHFPFCGEVYLGHLRYGTYGANGIAYCHPVIRNNNWRSRTLAIAGNFNLTNVDYLFDKLVRLGQYPRYQTDTTTILERMGYFLDEENKKVYHKYKEQIPKEQIASKIEQELDYRSWLEWSAKHWDGGYVIGGLIGHGACFIMRDPLGIRPCFFYENDEIFIAASEKPAIATAFNVAIQEILELKPAHAIIITPECQTLYFPFTPAQPQSSCTFERIYFSRGNDPDIYQERKALGAQLAPILAKELNYDWEHTVLTHIPNTSYPAFLGLSEGIRKIIYQQRIQQIKSQLNHENLDEQIEKILNYRPRIEQLIVKDAKLRTFISAEEGREDLVAYVYDVTYGIVRENKDIIVALDDSIVRGTTLKQSIIRMLGRLKPQKIVIVSSAPPICYPDCYGIDMSQIEKFVAFQAAIALLHKKNLEHIIHQTYYEIKALEQKNELTSENLVKNIYAPISLAELQLEIANLLRPEDLDCELSIVYQTIEGLKRSIPNHQGDWYFTGNYPTPGGNKVANRAFINFYEGIKQRAY